MRERRRTSGWRRLPAGTAVLVAVVSLTVGLAAAALGCGGGQQTTVRLIYAGSMIAPFDDLAREFQRRNPDVRVLTESHGSIQCIRQITEIHRGFDVLVTADYALIPPMMYQTRDDATGKAYANWYLRFATNKMVLAYSSKSRYAGQVSAQNWTSIIKRPGVRLGLADPRFDSAGYRALMVLMLAARYYEEPSLVVDLTMGRFEPPVVTSRTGGTDVVEIPELLATTPDSGIVLRGSSVQLLPLLQSGDVDYAFEYESVVRQQGLRYVELPAQVNLSSPKYSDLYASVMVRTDMRRFRTVKPEFRGEVILYGLTIPTNAPQAKAARRFVAFALGPVGRRVFARHYQPLIVPAAADHYGKLPAALKALSTPVTSAAAATSHVSAGAGASVVGGRAVRRHDAWAGPAIPGG